MCLDALKNNKKKIRPVNTIDNNNKNSGFADINQQKLITSNCIT